MYGKCDACDEGVEVEIEEVGTMELCEYCKNLYLLDREEE
jgi:hypothetical protein